MPDDDDDVRWVIDSERELLRPDVRRSADRVERLLHPDFVEFGASGRRWDRRAMVSAIGAELTDDTPLVVSDMAGARLADSVIMVTYVTERPDRRARRMSLWCKDNDGSWQLYCHQGTLLPPNAE